jgi:FlaA1/EpsC-like NDP-sugar epimerase
MQALAIFRWLAQDARPPRAPIKRPGAARHGLEASLESAGASGYVGLMDQRPPTPASHAAPSATAATLVQKGWDRFSSEHPWARRVLLCGLDAAILFVAFGLAYQIAFWVQVDDKAPPAYHRQFIFIIPILISIRLLLMGGMGLYRGFSRYTGMYELLNIVQACLAGTAGLVAFNLLNRHIPSLGSYYPKHPNGLYVLRVPWSVVAIDLLLAINALAGIRLSRRIVGEWLVDIGSGKRRRVLVVGAHDAGEQVARNMLKNYRDRFLPVAFITQRPSLIGRRIHGVPVAGLLDDLGKVCRRYRVDMVVIALQHSTPRVLRDLIDDAREEHLEFQIIPDLDELIEGKIEVSRLRPVEIEDLLGRPPVVVGDQSGQSCLAGRRVFVTGAGGSIGSEICRQALAHRPASLIIMGRGENSIYEIQHEIAARAALAEVQVFPIIGDARDRALVERVFARHQPQVILHAAAHKHVHFMEAEPAEAIKNNIMGTRNVAQAALAVGAERFVLISTDKAVRPAGVMGASKRVAEMIVTALNQEGKTRFISVRFGNVLGSRGSVIPLFRKQIAAGGPITVTHPDVTRYFMTIPEAVSLVIQAAQQGEGGEVFLLDMGEPIKIVNLARQLITLSGLEPGRDIAIEFTGLRPGEKMFEELLTSEENRTPTSHPKLFCSPREGRAWAELAPAIERLEAMACADQIDDAALRAMLGDLIPDFQGKPVGEPAA